MTATPSGNHSTLRREILIAGVTVSAVALTYRYASIPTDWELGLRTASETFDLPWANVGKWFSGWSIGDGQAFAVIAADPLGMQEGLQLDNPVYRYSRAGFGWLAGLASIGQPEWIPYGLSIVSFLALSGTFLLASKLRPILGVSAWFIVLNPAVFIAFAGDTAESLGVLVLSLAMATGRWWLGAALGVIRPSYTVALWGRWRLFLSSVLVAAAFGIVWSVHFGFNPSLYREILGPPIVGYLASPSPLGLLLAGLAAGTAGIGIRYRNWAWLVSGLFVLCLSETVVGGVALHGWRGSGMLFVLWAFGPEYSAPVLSRLFYRTSSPPAV